MKRIFELLSDIPSDKRLHIIAGLVIAAFFALVIPTGRLWCMAPAIVAGIAKELYDYFDYGKFDWVDMLYTITGGFVIQVFAWL